VELEYLFEKLEFSQTTGGKYFRNAIFSLVLLASMLVFPGFWKILQNFVEETSKKVFFPKNTEKYMMANGGLCYLIPLPHFSACIICNAFTSKSWLHIKKHAFNRNGISK